MSLFRRCEPAGNVCFAFLYSVMSRRFFCSFSEHLSEKKTTLRDQYSTLKKQNKGYLLMYKVGDFYQFYEEDAEMVSKDIQIRLTRSAGRRSNTDDQSDNRMCGFPVASAKTYIPRLLKLGHHLAITDQFKSKDAAEKLFSRKVVKRLTSGTVLDEEYIDPGSFNFLCSISADGSESLGVAWTDVSIGEAKVTSINSNFEALKQILSEIAPAEIVLSNACKERFSWIEEATEPFKVSEPSQSKNALSVNFLLTSSPIYDEAQISASIQLFEYLDYHEIGDMSLQELPQVLDRSSFLQIDETAYRALEISSTKTPSLLSVIDKTQTVSGRLLLKDRLRHPFTNLEKIERQQSDVEAFLKRPEIMKDVRSLLKKCPDITRCLQRVTMDRSSPRDFVHLKNSIDLCDELISKINYDPTLPQFPGMDSNLNQLNAEIHKALFELNGEICVRKKASSEIMELYSRRSTLERQKEDLRILYAETMGLPLDKIKIEQWPNAGCYIQISKSSSRLVKNLPSGFSLARDMQNCRRYETKELNLFDLKYRSLSRKIREKEQLILRKLRNHVIGLSKSIIQCSNNIADLDLTLAFAHLADTYNFCRPKMEISNQILIHHGRHPVVEQELLRNACQFVPNSVHLLEGGNSWFLTGPNMAGKSVMLRMVGQIVLLGHLGCFVPAERAVIGIVDRICCRLGSSDDIARNKSSFRIEMDEVSFILNNATERSLVLMDEVGRGTAILDGFSIAAAILCHLHDEIRCRAIFASHFHELQFLKRKLHRLSMKTMETFHDGEDHFFSYKLIDGVADESYGIDVAKTSGVPSSVSKNAASLLRNLRPVRSQLQNILDSSDRSAIRVSI